MRNSVLFILILLFHGVSIAQNTIMELGILPESISETSGLLFHNGKLITHNDSGNSAQLFEVDTLSLEITRIIDIENADNIDWEDMAQDEDFIYIGDFGNNLGIRTDLRVYRLSKRDFDTSDRVTVEQIDFTYEDQVEFVNEGNSDWDAEAFFVLDEVLILLTKQWKNNGTVAYSIPKEPGVYEARRIDFFDVQGLVTGATYNPLSEILYLIGYSSILAPFTVRVERPSATAVFGNEVIRSAFGDGLAQVEGITYVDVNSYLVSSEFFENSNFNITLQPKLFSFKTEDIITETPEEPVEPPPIEENEGHSLILYRTFGSTILEYDLTTSSTIFGRAIHDSNGRLLQYKRGVELEESRIDLSTFNTSIYYLTFYLDSGLLSKAFAK